jgi:hypothetical protein
MFRLLLDNITTVKKVRFLGLLLTSLPITGYCFVPEYLNTLEKIELDPYLKGALTIMLVGFLSIVLFIGATLTIQARKYAK